MATAIPLPRLKARTLACLTVIGLVAILAMRPMTAYAATFDPLNVISYETYRGATSMSDADIQAFLNTLTGPLKTLVAKDHNGVMKPASRIIGEASRAWSLNPRVVLATLQKEQSLLTTSNSSNSARLLKAMGCGVYPGSPNTYPGFGNQVWDGTRKLSTYEIQFGWVPGKSKTVTAYKSVDATKALNGQVVTYKKSVRYSKTIVPENASTFALYTYTPYYPQSLVWDIFVRYFGDPQTPPRMRPVYRFTSTSNGTYYYTRSEAKRYTLIRSSSKQWKYAGVALTVDASSTANASPVYRLYNTSTLRYIYATTASIRDAMLKAKPHVWRLDGTAFFVSKDAATGTRVFALYNKTTHAMLYTSSLSDKRRLTTGRSAKFSYKGVPFYLGVSATTTIPVGPVSLP